MATSEILVTAQWTAARPGARSSSRGERDAQGALPRHPHAVRPLDLQIARSLTAVRSLLAALTERQRAVVVLRLFDDLSEAQVAQILGCAVGTVKATMSQALARLRSDPHLADLMVRRAR
jgi:DNA-directed RNA polymerase specialized sigma24 family protein